MDFASSTHRRFWLFAKEHLDEVRQRQHREMSEFVETCQHDPIASGVTSLLSSGMIGTSAGSSSHPYEDTTTNSMMNDNTPAPALSKSAPFPTSSAPRKLPLATPLLSFDEEQRMVRWQLLRLFRELCPTGTRLNLTPELIGSALTFIQRYYLLNSVMVSDPRLIAASALYLSGKVEEQYLKEAHVTDITKIKVEEFIPLEPILLQGIRMQLYVYHPFESISSLCASFTQYINTLSTQDKIKLISGGKNNDDEMTTSTDISWLSSSSSTTLSSSPSSSPSSSSSSSSSSPSSSPSTSLDNLIKYWLYYQAERIALHTFASDLMFLYTPAQIAVSSLLAVAQCLIDTDTDAIFSHDATHPTSTPRTFYLHRSLCGVPVIGTEYAVYLGRAIYTYLTSPSAFPNVSSNDFPILQQRIHDLSKQILQVVKTNVATVKYMKQGGGIVGGATSNSNTEGVGIVGTGGSGTGTKSVGSVSSAAPGPEGWSLDNVWGYENQAKILRRAVTAVLEGKEQALLEESESDRMERSKKLREESERREELLLGLPSKRTTSQMNDGEGDMGDGEGKGQGGDDDDDDGGFVLHRSKVLRGESEGHDDVPSSLRKKVDRLAMLASDIKNEVDAIGGNGGRGGDDDHEGGNTPPLSRRLAFDGKS